MADKLRLRRSRAFRCFDSGFDALGTQLIDHATTWAFDREKGEPFKFCQFTAARRTTDIKDKPLTHTQIIQNHFLHKRLVFLANAEQLAARIGMADALSLIHHIGTANIMHTGNPSR